MSVRIDKFIWCIRICKTRSIATELVKKGKVRVNNQGIKPAKEVLQGDVIQVNKANAVFQYKVIKLLNNRVGAKLVDEYIEDITEEEEIEKYKTYQTAQSSYKQYGSGKPTKKDRRILDEFLSWDV
jgi:ribosome-associated heat shock protein Hsp15